jgi:hypothetical protein
MVKTVSRKPYNNFVMLNSIGTETDASDEERTNVTLKTYRKLGIVDTHIGMKISLISLQHKNVGILSDEGIS